MPIDGAIRVTEPLDYFKQPWYVKWVVRVGLRASNSICKEAQEIGTAVDTAIKTGEVKVKPKYRVEVENCLKAYRAWKEVYQPKEIVPGVRLFGVIGGIRVTGEPDLFVDDVLVDIKCARKISLAYWIQVCVYYFLQNARDDERGNSVCYGPRKVAILRLDKVTGSYEYVQKEFDGGLVDVWCGLANAMLYFKGEETDDCS